MMRKEDQEIANETLFTQPLGSRKRGRQRLHGRDKLDENARMFEIRNRWIVADRNEWKWFLKEAKTQKLVLEPVMIFQTPIQRSSMTTYRSSL